MKKLIVLATLFAFTVSPVSAETVRTCSTVYGGGEVCGETTTTTEVKHVVKETAVSNNEMINMLLSIAGAAVLATGLYKLTYKSYILG